MLLIALSAKNAILIVEVARERDRKFLKPPSKLHGRVSVQSS
jgi:multidrug efflux pump subunit AcrB